MESPIFNFSCQFLPQNKEAQNTEFEGPGFFYDVMDTAKFHFRLLPTVQIMTDFFQIQDRTYCLFVRSKYVHSYIRSNPISVPPH